MVPNRRDVFAKQKLASSSVHGCTLLDRLFSKALEAAHLRILLMAHFSLSGAIAVLLLHTAPEYMDFLKQGLTCNIKYITL